MHHESDLLLNGFGQLLQTERRIFGSLLNNKLHHFVGQFVSSLGAAFVGEQAEDSILLKGRLCLVEGGTREAESTRSLADRISVYVDLPQHLVLDLKQVVGIEELAVLKQGVDDSFRSRIEGTMAAKRLSLFLFFGRHHIVL